VIIRQLSLERKRQRLLMGLVPIRQKFQKVSSGSVRFSVPVLIFRDTAKLLENEHIWDFFQNAYLFVEVHFQQNIF
jgi:hypothetical protein